MKEIYKGYQIRVLDYCITKCPITTSHIPTALAASIYPILSFIYNILAVNLQ